MAEIKTEQELLLQNNDTFRDEGSDAAKLKGKTRAAEVRGFFGNIIASVFAALGAKSNVGHQHTISEVDNLQTTLNSHNQRITNNTNALPSKADLVAGKVPAEQLPDLAPTIESTDDIQNEGTTNLWFSEARAIAAKSTANLWSYIGLANSTATISLKGWMDFLTNKVKINEEQIALRVKQVKQGTTTFTPDASGLLTLPEAASVGAADLAFTTSLPFDKDYLINWTISAPTAFTKNATGFKKVKFIKGNIKADGVNKPTFSADFIINYYEWVNTAGKQHRVFFEAQADGKIAVDIMDA